MFNSVKINKFLKKLLNIGKQTLTITVIYIFTYTKAIAGMFIAYVCPFVKYIDYTIYNSITNKFTL